MFRFLRTSLRPKFKLFNFSSNKFIPDLTSLAEPNNEKHAFLESVYGIELKKHIFPNTDTVVELPP